MDRPCKRNSASILAGLIVSRATRPAVVLALGAPTLTDPTLTFLETNSNVLGYSEEGAAYISCPFKANHSREGDRTETIYFPAGLRGYELGHFNCFHASCTSRSDEEFLDALGARTGMFEDLGVLPPADVKPNRFTLIPIGEYSRRPPPEWIIDDILPRAELCVLFGKSGSGKSFLALDMIVLDCRGVDWNGYKTKPGRAVYICAEGMGGMRNRTKATGMHTGIDLDTMNCQIIAEFPQFINKR